MNNAMLIKLIRFFTCGFMVCCFYNLASAGEEDFQAFGGKAGLTKIVDDFMVNVLADPRIKEQFEDADIPHLKAMLVEQFCFLTGGACVYKGRDMKSVHKGLDITNAQFNALAEDLQIAMEKSNVPSLTQNKLLAKLAPMQREIVTK